ncbi:MAG: aminomethyltransferase family protein, partial [Pseudomonadota bacterium]
AGRDKKLSPNHARVRELGAQMGAYGGWERANWFAEPGDDVSEEATQTWARQGPWEPRVRAEAEAVRDAAGLLDLAGFSRYRLRGAGAAAFLAGLCAGALPAVGRLGLLYFADARGRIVTEMSAMRIAEDDILLITAAAAQWHDLAWLAQSARPEGAAFTLEDVTRAEHCALLTGPKAREILAPLTDADLSRPWLTHQAAQVAGAPARLARVSFAGELGWEIHTAAADAPAVYDALLAAGRPLGLRPFGMFALDSLRIEKGYRAWKGDLSTDYTLIEGGLERFLRLDKPEAFPGKSALAHERARGPVKRFVTLVVEAGDCDAPYMATLWSGDEIVGEVTSGRWGYRVGASVALGMLRSDLAKPGRKIAVEIYGERKAAVVQPDGPLWDPENARLKA